MHITLSLLLIFSFLVNTNPQEDIDSYLKQLQADGKLNGNVLIIKNDSVVYKNSFGYADAEKSELLTARHHFMIGSIYKEFPAVAIMQQVEKGLLDPEDKISEYLPHLPSWSKLISVKHLLQYSSGLPKVDWNMYFANGLKAEEEVIVNKLQELENLEFNPGSGYIYSNFNPFLLMRIVEKIDGKSFQQYMEQNILEPYGIEEIIIKNEYPYQDKTLMAIPYDEDFKADNFNYELTSICSSTTGLYKWFSMLDSYQIISRESMKILSEEAMEGDNIQAPLGRCDWLNDDISLHLHHGSTGNYECLVRNYKSERITIILLTNQKHRNLHEIADNIYAILK